MSRGKVWFFIISFGFTTIALVLIWGERGVLSLRNPDDLANVAIEFHGMVFDIILFGIILTIYEFITDKKNLIRRYNEEIDDFRGWDEKEATFRIVGNIKRLNKENIFNINLRFCNLKEARLDGMNLSGSDLSLVNMENAFLIETNLTGAFLNDANLTGTFLINTNLKNVDLSGANLENAKVNSVDWLQNLKHFSITGLEAIETKYYIDPVPHEKYKILYYLVKKKPKSMYY